MHELQKHDLLSPQCQDWRPTGFRHLLNPFQFYLIKLPTPPTNVKLIQYADNIYQFLSPPTSRA